MFMHEIQYRFQSVADILISLSNCRFCVAALSPALQPVAMGLIAFVGRLVRLLPHCGMRSVVAPPCLQSDISQRHALPIGACIVPTQLFVAIFLASALDKVRHGTRDRCADQAAMLTAGAPC